MEQMVAGMVQIQHYQTNKLWRIQSQTDLIRKRLYFVQDWIEFITGFIHEERFFHQFGYRMGGPGEPNLVSSDVLWEDNVPVQEQNPYGPDGDAHSPYEEGADPNSAPNHEANGNRVANDINNPFTNIEEDESKSSDCYIIRESNLNMSGSTLKEEEEETEEEPKEEEEETDEEKQDSDHGEEDSSMDTSDAEV